jgi:hypothetical protein
MTSIDNLLNRLEKTHQLTEDITVYAEGVRAKVKQALFSLSKLQEIRQKQELSDSLDSTTQPIADALLNSDEQALFYCESFWDFLRSSLDILGQLVNTRSTLGIAEKDVDIKKVYAELHAKATDKRLEKAISLCINSRAFKALQEYRHCSTHRRQVYIHRETITVDSSGTRGYGTYSGAALLHSGTTLVERYLCRNPASKKPKVDYKRPIIIYNEGLRTAMEWHIAHIVNLL